MTGSEESYLGDGLYARFDGYSIWLRAPREHGDHVVCLRAGGVGVAQEICQRSDREEIIMTDTKDISHATMTVSELIKSVRDKAEQHWVDCVKADLYAAGFNPDWTDPDYEDLQNEMRGWFTQVLRSLYHFAPVLVNDDPEDE
jgi:hypothetical protein